METQSLVQRRKDRLVHIAYFIVFAIIYYFFIEYALAIVAPFLVSFVIAMLLQKPINFLSDKMHGKGKKMFSFVFVSLIIILLVGVVVLLGYLITSEISSFVKFIVDKAKLVPGYVYDLRDKFDELVSRLPHAAQNAVQNTIDGIVDKFTGMVKTADENAQATVGASDTGSTIFSLIKAPLTGLWSTAKQIPAVLTAIVIGMVSCFFLTADYDGFTGMIKHAMSKESAANLSRAKHIIIDVLGKWLKSYMLILFITFCEMALGLVILKTLKIYETDYIFVIALCVAIVDIFPVFGTGTVLIPWSLYNIFTGKVSIGIGLLIIYAVITFIRQIIEPKLVSANVGMNPVITLMAMYVGIQLFGALGVLILPLTCIVVTTLNNEGVIHLWTTRKPEDEDEQSGDNPEDTKPDEAADPQEESRKAAIAEIAEADAE